MNQIDFLKYSQFPTSSETFQFMQSMLALVAKIASLGGNNYILEGCTESGNNVSAGVVVVNGEILPFTGGSKSTYVVISETRDSVQVYDTAYTDLYINRRVIFGTGSGQLAWSGFKRFTDLLAIATSLSALNNSFATHINNHSVAWASVTGKPSTYPPAAHEHAWSVITSKPITNFYLGEFDANGTVVTKLSGDLTVSVSKGGTGRYILSHYIGHTRYIVLGVGLGDNTRSLRSMDQIQNNSCQVVVSDDTGMDDNAVRFAILIF